MEKKEFDANPEMDDLLADLEDDWGIDPIQKFRKEKQEISLRTKVLGYVSVFLLIIGIFVFGFYYFLSLSLKPKNQFTGFEQQYVKFVKNSILSIFSTSNSTVNMNLAQPTITAINLHKYFSDPKTVVYDKLRFKEYFSNQHYQKIQKAYSELKKYQDMLVKYRFFPKELQDIIKDIKVLPILTTLNAIKLYVTDYVYIKAWLFKSQIFDFVYTRSKFPGKYWLISFDDLLKYIESDIQYFKDQGAYEYLKNIYFNYMYDSNDTLSNSYFVNKFKNIFFNRLLERYKDFKQKYSNLDKNQFMVDYIELIKNIYSRTLSLQKDSNIWVLPVDVQLLSYNPNSEELAFSIKLMLASEISSKIWPVQLLSDIVTLLRESRLIIGKTISYDNVKVKKITKRIWGYKLNFVSADQKFVTSVQPQVDLEVTDVSY